MSKLLDPRNFSLGNRTRIEELSPGHLAIIINRKSRIIMKDGISLMKKFDLIIKVKPASRLSLKTTAPICSKTRVFLENNDIGIIEID